MTEQPERELLLSIFLMEAWDTVSILEDGAPGLPTGGDVEPLLVVAHRLRGAAALHGFPRLADEAAAIETCWSGCPRPTRTSASRSRWLSAPR
jgi:chemosensory pili system protein ChpA (sensor histidine kinase/response regulator)